MIVLQATPESVVTKVSLSLSLLLLFSFKTFEDGFSYHVHFGDFGFENALLHFRKLQHCTEFYVNFKMVHQLNQSYNNYNCLKISDVDECSEDPYPCSHICNNEPGSFSCECRENYTLDTDNASCVGKILINLIRLDLLLDLKFW